MEYHCGIIFLLSIHLLLVLCVNGANVSAVEDCYWSGTGPICDGKCRLGEASEPNKNERIGCITGKKKYCCKTGTSLTNGTELAPPSTLQRDQERNTSALSPSTKDDCYWVGKSPNCEGSCLEGDYMASTSRTGNGSTCIVGKKKYCCKGSMTLMNNSTTSTSANVSMATVSKEKQTPPKKITGDQCRWVGEPPLCLGSCKFGEYVAAKSPTGDGGAKCESGHKKYCCARAKAAADGQTDTAKKTVRQSNQQSYGDVDPISNSSSRRPLLRPTPTANATGFKHRVNVVKIKRKLGLATTQSTFIPTSTTVPTTSSTATPSNTTSSTTETSTTTFTPSTTSTTPSTTTVSTTPSATTTTTSTTPSTTTTTTSVKVHETFLSLPDILPVPFMFRSRPISTIAKEQPKTTSIIPLSTSLASIDMRNETIVLTTATVGQP